MSSHPAAVAVLLPTLFVLQVGRRVCTHGGEHGLASTTDARVLLPLPEHKPCDRQIEVQCLYCQDSRDSVPAASEVHSCLALTWVPMSGGSVKTQRPRPRCSGTCTAVQIDLQTGIT